MTASPPLAFGFRSPRSGQSANRPIGVVGVGPTYHTGIGKLRSLLIQPPATFTNQAPVRALPTRTGRNEAVALSVYFKGLGIAHDKLQKNKWCPEEASNPIPFLLILPRLRRCGFRKGPRGSPQMAVKVLVRCLFKDSGPDCDGSVEGADRRPSDATRPYRCRKSIVETRYTSFRFEPAVPD